MKIDPSSLADQLRMLRGVQPIESPFSPRAPEELKPQDGKVSFSEMLEKQLLAVSNDGLEADRAIQKSILGQESSPHHTILAIQKATLSLSLMINIKDRLERAYQELMRTPLG